MIKVKFKKVGNANALMPDYQTPGASGMDLHAALAVPFVEIKPGERLLVPCGWAVEIPNGYEGQVRSRSGLAMRHGVMVLNSPGTIDADYRGELGALLINHGAETFTVRQGDRVAQLVIAAVCRVKQIETKVLGDTSRGEGGFGSTGVGGSR